jgi:hypothetical protein
VTYRDAVAEALNAPDVPPIVAAWCTQLLSPEFLSVVRAFPAEQVDVRLSASRGRVRPKPVVVFNGGPQELVDP